MVIDAADDLCPVMIDEGIGIWRKEELFKYLKYLS
jgi:hypothetical protein